ncbi:60S ribosomal L3 [Tubulinosema ratisbonensis]|uniref:60S ribosomal L3 n=1 Tax=Tubulinosema ratisbonensis TaxID=291195 RepID=A0A437APR8_9MICR|nr:60S ribosomal L3 [Tubulinosema ratisbonensis]
MSCRKFEAPRHGSLAFCPRKRASSVRQKIRAFEKDDPSAPIHLTGFNVYKAGMTHIIRNKVMKDKKATVKEIFEAVTILEAPPMVVFGIRGYVNTPTGLKLKKSVISSHVNESVLRRFYKNYRKLAKKGPLSLSSKDLSQQIESDIEILKECDSIRVLMHTQVDRIKPIKTKKAHISEIQVNGGNISDKVEWAVSMLEKEVKINEVFNEQELVDVVGVTKGKGFTGVTKRFGTRILPRKTNKGKRKVACIGAWHPANVLFSVPRAGQLGFHRRTEYNKMVYKLGHGNEEIKTEFDLTKKAITPMGGFSHYGNVSNEYIMLKGCVPGPRKRVLTLRKNLYNKVSNEKVQIKFIDTSSKTGKGRFQTTEEKRAFFGIKKKAIN